jgi:hypothetical protein
MYGRLNPLKQEIRVLRLPPKNGGRTVQPENPLADDAPLQSTDSKIQELDKPSLLGVLSRHPSSLLTEFISKTDDIIEDAIRSVMSFPSFSDGN